MTDKPPNTGRLIPKAERSLNEILGVESAPAEGDWALAHRIFRAASIPIGVLSDWDLGLLLRQRQGASHILPVAFERLAQDLWNEAGLYPGALLIAALHNQGCLPAALHLNEELAQLAERAASRSHELSASDRLAFEEQLSRLASKR